MSYNYYCTYCGRALSQETVLYNMNALLTGNDQTDLQILKFRLTGKELRELYETGEASDLGYRRCKITLERLMQWIANSNNLNDPVIAELNIEDIIDYFKATVREATPKAKKMDMFVALNDSEDEKQESEPAQISKQEKEQLHRSEAILSLEEKDQAIRNKVYSEVSLQNELQNLRNRFVSTDAKTNKEIEIVYSFDLRLNTEKDNDGRDVLTGYYFRNGSTIITVSEARVCPFCSDKLFKYAGTAEHRLITFVGDQDAGKTCTILALTHYAKNAMSMQAMPDDPIWSRARCIDSIATVELLTTDEKLWIDLKRYSNGMAPDKNDANKRIDAYSATFRIQNKDQRKIFLVTLIDLPGELCNENGTINNNVILSEFQVALACDVFVLCFDSTTAVGGDAVNMISKVCSWGNSFQDLRAQFKADEKGTTLPKGCYAPIMVLYTKCPELESGKKVDVDSVSQSPLTRLYTFASEKEQIDGNEVYRRVGQQMRYYNHLTDVYTASLRCSPYGFPAPKQEDIDDGTKTNKDTSGQVITPRPIHIPELMRWLLSVAGCIPTDASYYPNANTPQVFSPESNYILRPQYLSQIPRGEGRNGDLNEALSRCYLFEAPGTVDWDYVQYYDQTALLNLARIRARFFGNKKIIRGNRHK